MLPHRRRFYGADGGRHAIPLRHRHDSHSITPPHITLQRRPHTSIILSWIWRPPSLSAGPSSTILDTKIPSFEVLSLSSYGENSHYYQENNNKKKYCDHKIQHVSKALDLGSLVHTKVLLTSTEHKEAVCWCAPGLALHSAPEATQNWRLEVDYFFFDI